MAKILQVRQGKIKPLAKKGEVFQSAYQKESTGEPVELGLLGLAEDEQADASCHGGEDKAVLVFSNNHYDLYANNEGSILAAGTFGENILIDELDEDDVNVGDVFAIEDVRLQVSQPRQPCWKISTVAGKEVMQYVVKHAATGWYCRILKGGTIRHGMSMERVERSTTFSIKTLTDYLHKAPDDPGVIDSLLQCESLAESYKIDLRKKIA